MKHVPTDPQSRIEIWEWALDTLALRIDQLGDEGMVYLDLYKRTERELEAELEKADTLKSMRDRLKRRQVKAHQSSTARS